MTAAPGVAPVTPGAAPSCPHRNGHDNPVSALRCEAERVYSQAVIDHARWLTDQGCPTINGRDAYDLWSHLRDLSDDGYSAMLRAKKVIGIGWRPFQMVKE